MSEQHDFIHINVNICMGGSSIHLIAPLDLNNITTIALVFQCFILNSKAQPVYDAIEE